MNHYSTTKKYFPALIGAALLAASLFQFSRPVFSAGTTAGQVIRNTATGTYEDNDGNNYTIDSNTVEVTVAKVAGITNIPSGFSDDTSSPTNTSVLTGDTVSFTFTITNVGNDTSNIHIPTIADIVAANGTKGLDTSSLVMTADLNGNGTFNGDITPNANGDIIIEDVPANGQIFIKVTGEVTATAAGAPIEVLLGDTGSNGDPNDPVADTQNQFDDGQNGDTSQADNEVRTLNPTTQTAGVTNLPAAEQKEASAKRQVFLGSNPLAAVKIEKTRGAVQDGATADLDDNIIPYDIELEVLTSTPSSLNTPGELEGRDFTGRMPAGIGDVTNLVLVSDAIPVNTQLNTPTSGFTDADGRTWTPVYAVGTEPTPNDNLNPAADQIDWVTAPSQLNTVIRVGWVYDANQGTIKPGTTVTGFSFNVITNGLDPDDGGTVANIAQVFGRTFDGNPADGPNGPKVFDESGDQDPSNFNGINPGPDETVLSSRGLANPAGHGVDSENNNNANDADPDSPGGEDNVITIGAAGDLINGPDGQPAATGNVFITDSDNDHDFQNKGIDNFADANGSDNPQQGAGNTLDPNAVVFTNTLSNPGTTDLSDVLLQPINPNFDDFDGTGQNLDANLPSGTKVTINLGTQQAIYTYTVTGTGANAVGEFTLDANTPTAASQPIRIPTIAAGVPLDYTVTVDLPGGTELSTDVDHGFPVPIIAFIDPNNNGTPDAGENSNYTVNQVYTGFIKVEKQVKVVRDGVDVPGMGFANDNADKQPLPGDVLLYRINYRNISEPQVGNGNNLVLEGIDVMIDENGTLDNITTVTNGNNWGLDNNGDGDLDTINVQNTAADTSNGTITYYTGTSAANSTDVYSVDTLTSAGTTDPGDAVTGYRVTVPSVPPTADPFRFTFQRKVDEFDGLAQEGLD